MVFCLLFRHVGFLLNPLLNTLRCNLIVLDSGPNHLRMYCRGPDYQRLHLITLNSCSVEIKRKHTHTHTHTHTKILLSSELYLRHHACYQIANDQSSRFAVLIFVLQLCFLPRLRAIPYFNLIKY